MTPYKGSVGSPELCHIIAFHTDIGVKCGPLSLLSLKCASNEYHGSLGDLCDYFFFICFQSLAVGAPSGYQESSSF